MSDQTKVMLSGGELAMASDRRAILTKHAVMQAAAALFTSLIPAIQDAFLPVIAECPPLVSSVPKISKGENYRGFPYVIMDHPASFEKENIFALRTMFWWGHFISITLHLSGKYKTAFTENILNGINGNSFFIAAGEEEWQHHFEEDNFRPVSDLTTEKKNGIASKDFLKIALKYDLQDWNRMPELLPEGYKQVSKLLKVED